MKCSLSGSSYWKNIFSKYFYALPTEGWKMIKRLPFWLAAYARVSFSWKPERLIVLSWLQSSYPPKKTINTNMMDVNAKQRWLQGDWLSSVQLAFFEGMTAVKANQPFTETQHVPHLLHVPNRHVPIYLSHGNMPKSCQTFILLDLHCVILVMRNICLVSGGRCSAGVWPFHRIS